MSLPDQTPKLPKLPFLIGDAVLLAAAWFIFDQSHGRLSAAEVYAIAGCVGIGAILAAIPFLSDYARKQDEALDERQRGLEALSRTVNTAAEQISIAANGMHEIVELAHKNLKHAEQLPQKLQEKIAEFNAQLDNAREDDREELEKELVELRASESERLQSAAEKIHKDVAELTRLDGAVQKHLTARTELVSRAGETIAKAQADVAAALNDSVASAARRLGEAQTKALAEIDARLADRTVAAVAAIEAAAAAAVRAIAASVPAAPPAPAVTAEPPAVPSSSPEIASPPKKPRKSRREEPAATEATSADPSPVEPPAPETAAEPPTPAAAPSALSSEPPAPAVESAPTPVEPAAIEPTASVVEPPPAVSEPPALIPESPAPETAPAPAAEPAESQSPANENAAPAAAAEVASEERPTRKRSPRKPAAEPHAELPLDLGDSLAGGDADDTPVSRSEVVERVISSDGATRLIVTAYIGIGNRLFVRGDGPGLSWDKGVPLQFVSIGKWRWETSDASAPVSVKLYKNDETECGALGTLTLEPGHQQEVTAKF